LVSIYPRVNDGESITNKITWLGEENERRLCEFCKTAKLNRIGRYYICPSCNQRFALADSPEEVRVDLNVSKLDVHPALVFKDKASDEEIRSNNEDELLRKYKLNKYDDLDDLKTLKRPGVTIKDDVEH
jgi:hypothetical protein